MYSNQEQSHLEIHKISYEKIDLKFIGPPSSGQFITNPNHIRDLTRIFRQQSKITPGN